MQHSESHVDSILDPAYDPEHSVDVLCTWQVFSL